MSDLAGHDLVDGNTGADIGSAFLHPHTGEEGPVCSGVIPGAIRTCRRIDVVKSAKNLNVLTQFGQWFKRAAEFEIGFAALWPPGRRDCAVREVQEGGSQRRAGGSRCQLSGRWRSRKF